LLPLLPNLLSGLRLALTPYVVLALMARDCRRALLIVFFCGMTDGLDGFLARRFRWQSKLGAYLDPLADKFLLVSVYISLALSGLAPVWLVWLVVGRDILILAMAGYALVFTRLRDFPPSIWGKISTMVQIATALALMASCAIPSNFGDQFAQFGIVLTAIVTAWSGIRYALRGIQSLSRNSSKSATSGR
jgi:cardiolipin synthase (CMP-forming)